LAPVASISVGTKSVESIRSSQTRPSGVLPFQRAIIGTRIPASVVSRLPPGTTRLPIFEVISGGVPLSAKKTRIVFSASPKRSTAFTILPISRSRYFTMSAKYLGSSFSRSAVFQSALTGVVLKGPCVSGMA
jgi:hypothetical protein